MNGIQASGQADVAVMRAEPEAVQTDILERDPAVDGLRGLALCMVLMQHGLRLAPTGAIAEAVQATAATMFIAIDLFFVLSGFLITSILLRTRETPGYFKNFYARRALRVFPAYYLVLGLVFLLRPYADGPDLHKMDRDAPFYLLYLQNILMAWRGHAGAWVGLDHTWSMPVEEQFYFLWPILVFVAPAHRLLRVCLIIGLGSLLIRLTMDIAGLSLWAQYVTTVAHAEGLALGAGLAALIHVHGFRSPPWWLRAAGFASLGYLVLTHPSWERQHVLHSLIASVFFVFLLFETLVAAPRTPLRRILASGTLTFMGRYSYGVYLIHFPVLYVVYAHLWEPWKVSLGTNPAILATTAVMLAVTFPMAIVMYHGIELPILRLKRFFPPTRSRPAPTNDAVPAPP